MKEHHILTTKLVFELAKHLNRVYEFIHILVIFFFHEPNFTPSIIDKLIQAIQTAMNYLFGELVRGVRKAALGDPAIKKVRHQVCLPDVYMKIITN